MVTYIIKAILFSALLLVIYRLFLEKEKMHRFNRFYLLLSIILPVAVPLVPIQTGSPVLSAFEPVITARDNLAGLNLTDRFTPFDSAVESSAANNSTSVNDIYGINSNNEFVAESSHDTAGSENHAVHGDLYNHGNIIDVAGESISGKNNRLLGNLLLFVYLAVTTGFLFRFSRNIHAFSEKVRNNSLVPYYEAKLVLTREDIIPYSFLNYIFVNEDDYKNGAIEPAVLGHELTHIRQKHTFDILFFELVRIFGWINPFLPFYRNALRLNHEFLADECVVREYCDQVTYQMLLFKTIRQENRMALSSPFNYLFTKKRMIMMSKKASPKSAVSKQLALIPVTGLAALLFMNITVATDIKEAAGTQIVTNDIISAEADIGKEIGVKSVIDPEGVKRGSDSDSNTASPALSPPPSSSQQEQDRSTRPRIQAPPPLFSDDFILVPPTSADLKSFQWPDYLVFIDGYMQNRNILEYYQETDFAHYHVIENNTENSVSFVYFLTHEYHQRQRGSQPEQLLPPGRGVSAELLEEYEKIIKKYTPASMTGGEQSRNIRENISLSDKSRLEEIYLQMSVEQRTDQRVIFRPYPVFSRSVPTSIQFESFKDPKLYGVWIDGNRVDNSALENYSHTDFARMSISTLMKNAVNYGEHVYQLNLMTHSYFEDFRDRMSGRTGNMLIYRIRVNQDEASELQPNGAVQAGNISWEVVRRTDPSGNEFNEISGVFAGTMQSKDVLEAPLKVKIFVTNRRGGEMFTEFYEAGSESPAKLYPESPNYAKIIVYSRLPSGEIIEMEQTSGGSHMWDFYIRDVTPAGSSQDLRYGEPREGDFLNFILEQDEILNIRVQLHPATHKIYRFDIDPTGLKELFAGL